jgi:hypothetical protein
MKIRRLAAAAALALSFLAFAAPPTAQAQNKEKSPSDRQKEKQLSGRQKDKIKKGKEKVDQKQKEAANKVYDRSVLREVTIKFEDEDAIKNKGESRNSDLIINYVTLDKQGKITASLQPIKIKGGKGEATLKCFPGSPLHGVSKFNMGETAAGKPNVIHGTVVPILVPKTDCEVKLGGGMITVPKVTETGLSKEERATRENASSNAKEVVEAVQSGRKEVVLDQGRKEVILDLSGSQKQSDSSAQQGQSDGSSAPAPAPAKQ